MKVWLDDCRPIPPEFDVRAKTAQEAIAYLSAGKVTLISLDHDLGDESVVGSGYTVAAFLEESAFHHRLPKAEWRIHSANPVGRKRMEQALQNADRFWEMGETGR